jgi:predicted RNA-binding protein YlxR (DUF448 family)
MESKPKKELLRFVKEDEKPRVDPTGKANGRGVYLCRDMDCFAKARKRKALERGLALQGWTEDEKETLKAEFERQLTMEVAE